MTNEAMPQRIGPYQVVDVLGKGGMGAVYRAYKPPLRRYVAVKTIKAEYTSTPGALERFRREAELASDLKHPNIVTVFDYEEVPGGDSYLVTELIEGGQTLRDRMSKGSMTLPEIADVLAQVGSALDYAYDKAQIVHRDIKPSNVFIEGKRVALGDFGIAKTLANDTGLTAVNQGVGTPDYMSPEQAMNDGLDRRSDIYSMGVMLFEMLTGRVPFSGESSFSVVLSHLQEPVPPLRKFNPHAPVIFQPVVEKAMAKRKEDRYETVGDLAAAFKEALERFGKDPATPPPPAIRQPEAPTGVMATAATSPEAVRGYLERIAQLESQGRTQDAFNRLSDLHQQFPQDTEIGWRYQSYKDRGFNYTGSGATGFYTPPAKPGEGQSTQVIGSIPSGGYDPATMAVNFKQSQPSTMTPPPIDAPTDAIPNNLPPLFSNPLSPMPASTSPNPATPFPGNNPATPPPTNSASSPTDAAVPTPTADPAPTPPPADDTPFSYTQAYKIVNRDQLAQAAAEQAKQATPPPANTPATPPPVNQSQSVTSAPSGPPTPPPADDTPFSYTQAYKLVHREEPKPGKQSKQKSQPTPAPFVQNNPATPAVQNNQPAPAMVGNTPAPFITGPAPAAAPTNKKALPLPMPALIGIGVGVVLVIALVLILALGGNKGGSPVAATTPGKTTPGKLTPGVVRTTPGAKATTGSGQAGDSSPVAISGPGSSQVVPGNGSTNNNGGTSGNNPQARAAAQDGDALFKQKDYKGAAEKYKQAINLDANTVAYYESLVQCYLNLNDYNSMLSPASKAAVLNPTSAEDQYYLGLAYYWLGRYNDAEAPFRAAAQIRIAEPLFPQYLARTLVAEGRYDEAVSAAQEALKLDPSLGESHNALGRAYLGQGKFAEAEKEFRTAISQDSKNAVFEYNLALTLINLKRYPDAEQELRKAVAIDDKYAPAWQTLSVALRNQNKDNDALDAANKAVTLNPKASVNQLELALVFNKLKRYPEAEQAARAAVLIDANSAENNAALAEALFGQNNYDGAKEAYINAANADPTNYVYLTRLGDIYAKVPDYENARQAYQQALLIKPDYQPATDGYNAVKDK